MKKNGELTSRVYCWVDIADIVEIIGNAIIRNVKNFRLEGCSDNMVWGKSPHISISGRLCEKAVINDWDNSVDVLEYTDIDEEQITEDVLNDLKDAEPSLKFIIDRDNDCYFMTDDGEEI